MNPSSSPADVQLACMYCPATFSNDAAGHTALTEHMDSYVCRLSDTAATVGALCRFGEMLGTKADRKQVWRIVGLPIPTASRKVERENYRDQAVTGGPVVHAPLYGLAPATDEDRARYADTTPAAQVFPGSVVTPATARLSGVTVEDRLVVLKVNANGSLDLARLCASDGRYWSKVPRVNVSDPLPREEV
jgi:hypothetical protein